LNKLDNQVVKSNDPLPKQDIVWIVSGGKGSGKSTMVLNVLKNKHAYGRWFDNVYLVSPTSRNDKKFEKLVKELDTEGKYFSECNEEVIDEIIERLKAFNESFDEEEEGRKPHNLVLFDDCLAFLPKSTQKSRFNELITTSRHLKTSVWILVQKYNRVNPIIRAQMDLLSIFHTNNKKELESLEDDLNLNKHQFEEIYDFATSGNNSFLHISFFGGKPKYFKKFDEIMLE
jgi:polyhydroxyalkanoate synthesis regulator phasin